MDILFYDVECYKYDWTVTFKSLKSQKYYYFHNDNVGIRDFVNKNLKNLLCGWNSKMYDDYMLLGMINGLSNFELKQLNDWIIEKKRLPWEFPLLNGKWRNFKSFDLRDDMYRNLSLKVIEVI